METRHATVSFFPLSCSNLFVFLLSFHNFCDPRGTNTSVKMASIKMQLEVATRHAGKNKRSSHIFMSAATKREREGTKDSASHKHDSSNLGALPLESYDLVTKKKAP